jgi:YggT family protein
MDAFWTIYGVVVFTFFIALIGRFVIDWVQVLARSWRPPGSSWSSPRPSTP